MNRLAQPRCSAGFTLLELVVVITITSIIAAAMAVFFTPAMRSYFDTVRRAGLTDMANTALRRMGRDIRLAVPNSIRIASDASHQCFELVPSKTGGLYRSDPDTTNANSNPLDVTQPDVKFDVLSPLTAVPNAQDFVVIGNQNTQDVYAAASPTRGVVQSWTSPPSPGGTAIGTGTLTLASATQFPSGYYGGRFFIVDRNNPAVFYSCTWGTSNGVGTGQLIRWAETTLTPAYPSSCPSSGTGTVVASHVSSCTFAYNPNQGNTQQSGFMWIQLELMDNNERVAMSYGVHVSNVP